MNWKAKLIIFGIGVIANGIIIGTIYHSTNEVKKEYEEATRKLEQRQLEHLEMLRELKDYLEEQKKKNK